MSFTTIGAAFGFIRDYNFRNKTTADVERDFVAAFGDNDKTKELAKYFVGVDKKGKDIGIVGNKSVPLDEHGHVKLDYDSLSLTNLISEASGLGETDDKKSGKYPTHYKGETSLTDSEDNIYDVYVEAPADDYRANKPFAGKRFALGDGYGEIRKFNGKDVGFKDHDSDGKIEPIDVFFGNGDLKDPNTKIFVIDQLDKEGKIDEPKVVFAPNAKEAKMFYLETWPDDKKADGEKQIGQITEFPQQDFPKFMEWASKLPDGKYPGIEVYKNPQQSQAPAQPAQDQTQPDTTPPENSHGFNFEEARQWRKEHANHKTANPLWLGRGNTGEEVARLSDALEAAGYDGLAGNRKDVFGKRMEKAVKDLERQYGLRQTGVFGEQACTALQIREAEIAIKNARDNGFDNASLAKVVEELGDVRDNVAALKEDHRMTKGISRATEALTTQIKLFNQEIDSSDIKAQLSSLSQTREATETPPR